MFRMIANLLQQNDIAGFLALVFAISLTGFILMWWNPAWQSPENPAALPVWLLAVWSPTISALIIWGAKGQFLQKLKISFSLPTLTPWLIILVIPLVITSVLLFIKSGANSSGEAGISSGTILFLILINLAMGPLGEEAGWRGFLLNRIQDQTGWLGASLIIGFVWTVWHAPLWMIDSPQSEISFLVFMGHVFCYSVLMTILYQVSGGSLVPVILFHLLVNIVSGYIVLTGAMDTAAFYKHSLPYYTGATALFAGIYQYTKERACAVG